MSQLTSNQIGLTDAFATVLSSLQNQRRRLEMISSNVANINTIGFKSSRMTFLEMFGQTIGIKYTPFIQGNFTATENPTDLAIKGDSFFIVTDGNEMHYTRAGAFTFNEQGVLVTQTGEKVQGWMLPLSADQNSTAIQSQGLNSIETLGDIILDPNLAIGAIATENVYLGGNLDAGDAIETNVLTSTDSFTYMSNGEVQNATESTLLSDLNQATNLTTGTITISGTDSEGNAITPVDFNFDATSTVGDLLNAINQAFNGIATATLVDGKIVLTDDTPGDSQTSIDLTLSNAAGGGTLVLPVFEVTTAGYTPKASTSFVIYDSFGTPHNLTITFTKTNHLREWAWEITASGDETITAGGAGTITFDASGNFANRSFDDGSGQLVIDPGNGAGMLSINVWVTSYNGRGGLTQYNSINTLSVIDQDGQRSGKLQTFNIDKDGYITGTFSNGVTVKLAQIALAQFADPSALQKITNSDFIPTQDSGEAVIGTASQLGSEILSGSLEMSNVELSQQFVEMIDAQKNYQAASRMVTTLNQIFQTTTQFGRF